jgi:hypothetical protein
VVRVLNVVDAMPVPERGSGYGADVWSRIEPQIARRRWRLFPAATWRWAWAGAAAVALLAVAFLAGRHYPQARPAGSIAGDTKVRERVLLVAVGDYLERSQMVLVELANTRASGPLDIASEQERVRDLVSETRLYRQTAASTGTAEVAGLLDELERVLVEIAQGPSRLEPDALARLRDRLEGEGIIFKIRVVNSNMRSREESTQATPAKGQTL